MSFWDSLYNFCIFFRDKEIFSFLCLLEKGCTEEQLLQAAEKAYEAPSGRLKSDLKQLLQILETTGYLIRTE